MPYLLVSKDLADLRPGRWEVDPAHSDVGFSVRHLVVSRVRGGFTSFRGTVTIDAAPLSSSAAGEIDVASVDTRDATRDAHLRSAEFFDAERFGLITFTSTGVRYADERFILAGLLRIREVTRPVELDVALVGIGPDEDGTLRAGYNVTTTLSRRDFGLLWNALLETGNAIVSDDVRVDLSIETVLSAPT